MLVRRKFVNKADSGKDNTIARDYLTGISSLLALTASSSELPALVIRDPDPNAPQVCCIHGLYRLVVPFIKVISPLFDVCSRVGDLF
jgi:hypothetical protein